MLIGGNTRSGKILVLTAFVLIILFGVTALAIDVGVVLLTRTQLHVASDAGSLAAGTELLSGLGVSAYRTPAEVKTAGQTQAVNYVAKHPAAEVASLTIDPDANTQFGKASFDQESGTWTFTWGATPYNAVGVTTLRTDAASDGALPLVFARVLGRNTSQVSADSVAVIMPASGIRIPPGSEISSGLSPFAFSKETWDKYWRARNHFDANNYSESNLTEANGGHLHTDADDLDELGNPRPLYYEKLVQGGTTTYRRLFGDRFSVANPELETAANVLESPDGILEMNIYPINSEAGNFGTVNIGNDSNSTQVLSDQIENGLSDQYLSGYEDFTIDPSADNPLKLNGDTGISAGIQASLESIIGQKRTILLYETVVDPGNTATYTIVEMVGVRFMSVELQGKGKTLIIQPESISDPTGLPDYDEQIGTETSFFTPLILAK